MGSFTSKEFDDLLEDGPQTPVSGKRVLTFDPRSPTVGISRTPIQVEKTPEKLVDPRSPTTGILRTPILNAEREQALRGSSGRLRRHSFSEGSPIKLDPLTMKEALASLPPLNLDFEDPEDCVQLLKRSNSEPELNVAVVEVFQEKKSVVSKPSCKSVRNRKPKTALFQGNTNINEIFVDAPRSPLRIISDSHHQRSPLGKKNIDLNSPRSIVQRKQTNKLGMLKSKNTPAKSAGNSPCRFEAAEDKENLNNSNLA